MKKTPRSTIGEIPDLDRFVSQGAEPPAPAPKAPAAAATERAKEPSVAVTVRPSEAMHKRVKVHCAMTGQSIQEFTLRAWEAQLAAEQKSA